MNYFSTALLHFADEGPIKPGIVIDDLSSWLVSDRSVERVWVLRRRVVPPNEHIADLMDLSARLVCDLADGTVLVESGQSAEVLNWNRGGVVRADQGVGVRWVAHNDNLHCFLRNSVQSRSLGLENFGVRLQQI